MSRRYKTSKAMWISPYSNLNVRTIEWDRRVTDANNARYLELAEVALRPRKANSKNAAGAQPWSTRQARP